MSAVYDKQGLHFEYPENWTLDESAATDGEVTVNSPGGGFWSVVVCGSADDPRKYAESSLSAMREEYEQLDVEPVEETVAGHRLTGYDLNFFCMDLTNSARIRAVRTLDAVLLILCQAEDREFDHAAPVYAAMTTSLLSHARPIKAADWPPRKNT